jgi:hypothetical protein
MALRGLCSHVHVNDSAHMDFLPRQVGKARESSTESIRAPNEVQDPASGFGPERWRRSDSPFNGVCKRIDSDLDAGGASLQGRPCRSGPSLLRDEGATRSPQ